MAKTTRGSERRADALTRERIVEAAIGLLDAQGEAGLTFRALAARLETGHGAIQWHVANKGELLKAATEDVIARAVTGAGVVDDARPREAIRGIASGMFEAIDAHPWVGAELSREPWQSALLPIFEGVGGQLQALGVPGPAQFDCASAILSYLLGLAGQYAAGIRLLPRDTDRSAFLGTLAAQWEQLDPARYPFTRQSATRLRDGRRGRARGSPTRRRRTDSLRGNSAAS
jgi:AcrR family transcriptional regulator